MPTLEQSPVRPLKKRMIGLAGAALWLVAISAGFSILSLAMIGTPGARFALIAVAIAAAVYLAIGAGAIRALLRLPGVAPPRTSADRLMLRRFAWVGGAEVVAIMVVNGVCAATQHLEAIVPLDLVIVGIHFFPLASIFKVRRYHVMGGLFCAASVLTMALVPSNAQVGAAAAWFVWPTFGCGSSAWVIAALNLREAQRYVRDEKARPAN